MSPARDESVTVILHPRHGPGLQQALEEHKPISVVSPDDHRGVARALADNPALVTFDWDDAFLPGLRWVQAISAGLDQFPLERLEAAGVTLTSARGVHTPSVAEHALALLFSLTRGLGQAVRNMPAREWKPQMATEIRTLRVAVVGLGSIGTEIARLLEAIGAEVLGVNRTGRHGSIGNVFDVSQLLHVCNEADAIICVLPNTPETHHLVGASHLEALGGWVVNVGRGSTIDERALIEALRSGRLEGAGLDVTEVEPLPEDSPLWEMGNVVVTPHTAWATSHLASRLAELVAHNALAFAGRGDWRNRIL